jgi:hypothetical protein
MQFLCIKHKHSHMSFQEKFHFFEYLRYWININVVHNMGFMQFLYKPMKTKFHIEFVQIHELWQVCDVNYSLIPLTPFIWVLWWWSKKGPSSEKSWLTINYNISRIKMKQLIGFKRIWFGDIPIWLKSWTWHLAKLPTSKIKK